MLTAVVLLTCFIPALLSAEEMATVDTADSLTEDPFVTTSNTNDTLMDTPSAQNNSSGLTYDSLSSTTASSHLTDAKHDTVPTIEDKTISKRGKIVIAATSTAAVVGGLVTYFFISKNGRSEEKEIPDPPDPPDY
jgi:hypothetical protein